jgi:cephalosporin hydroxylase
MREDGVLSGVSERNTLKKFFYARDVGPGIWKWDHYFDIYERHFYRFRGCPVTVAEIGIYSGGSLDMWQYYFGPQARIIGIDIEPDCRIYERDGISIYIGDQGDRAFWKMFRDAEPNIDILIDDGSHKKKHQLLTFTEMIGHISPGGVYLCEDIHGYPVNDFGNYIAGLATHLNEHLLFQKDEYDNDRRLSKMTTDLQSMVKSVSFYPYVCVVEKNDVAVHEFVAPKRGTEWQPFRP